MSAVDIALSVSLGLDICGPATKDEPAQESNEAQKLYNKMLELWQQTMVKNRS